jgi:predicted membrane channel-forming protein YqfA (hemolysin III family)
VTEQRLDGHRASHGSFISQVRLLRGRLLHRTFYYLLADLFVFLIVGTILPMAYLSARGVTGKALLLLGFGLCALAVVVILFVEMTQIRKAADLSRDSF